MKRAWILALVVGMLPLSSCSGPAQGQTGAASDGSDKMVAAKVKAPAAASVFSHDEAVKLYHEAKYAEAEKMCRDAIAAIEKANGAKSWLVAEPLIDLTTVEMRLAKYGECKQLIDRANSVLDKTVPEQALMYGRLGINKSWRLYTMGETNSAAKVCEEARDILIKFGKTPGGESVDLAEVVNNLGLMYEEQADKSNDPDLMDKARVELTRGYQMRKKLTGDESPETGESLNNLGMHLLFNPKAAGDGNLAIATLKKSLEVATKVYGESHPETAVAHATMALALYMEDDVDGAEKEVMIAMPITQKFLGDNHPDMAYELSTLARIQIDKNKIDDAEKSFLKVVEINEKVFGTTSPQVLPSLETLQKLYTEKGDKEKAADVEKKIERISGREL